MRDLSFLTSSRPEECWSKKQQVGLWAWNGGWTAVAGLGIGLLSLLLAVGPYSIRLTLGYFERPVILLLNLLPVLALTLLFYGVTGRAHWTFLLTAAPVLGLTVGNYYKLAFRDDPLMFADLFLLKEAGNMAGKYHLFLDHRLVPALVAVVGGFVFLRFLVRGRPGRTCRVGCAAGGALALALLIPLMLNSHIYNVTAAYYERLNNRWSSTQQYIARGFLYPFVHSIGDAFESPPPGYREADAKALLDAYENVDIPEDKKVNVVCVMLEAFQDFSRFDVLELPEDIYADYHTLEAESFRGDLVANIFAGGTVDTERCFLTGYSHLPAFRGKTNSYPWYFRSQDYQVTGMHPCFQWFYNRLNINENLGFEDYFFIENHFKVYSETIPSADRYFFPDLIADLTQRQTGAPIFSFSVNYQGHGPYPADSCVWGDADEILTPALKAAYTPQAYNILANYFGSVRDTSHYLVELRDFLAAQDEPYVLVLFGDHNPWLGDGNSVYNAMGLNLDQGTQEGFRNYYATRYLIWANTAAKAATGNDFLGDGPTLGPYFLMNQLFTLCGWDGPAYLQATNAVARTVPVQHENGMHLENGLFTQSLSEEGAALTRDYEWLQHYDKHHFRYPDVD